MAIHKCKKCGTEFNYIDILDSSGWGFKPMICRKCGSKHKLKMRYIISFAVVLSLPMFFICKNCSLQTSLKVKIILLLAYIIYMAAVVGVYPFIVQYSLNELEAE